MQERCQRYFIGDEDAGIAKDVPEAQLLDDDRVPLDTQQLHMRLVVSRPELMF